MGHVKGIGGLFFRARAPEALALWYRERLGVGGGCSADDAEALAIPGGKCLRVARPEKQSADAFDMSHAGLP